MDFWKKELRKDIKSGALAKKEKLIEIFLKDISDNGYTVSITDDDEGRKTYLMLEIKELPRWQFGLWIYCDMKKNKCEAEFFAQRIEWLDKFKPTRSNFVEKLYLQKYHESDKDDNIIEVESVGSEGSIEMLNFMRKEPALAFCKDQYGWDYNREYHTRKEAERKMKKDIKEYDDEMHWKDYYNNKIKDYWENKILANPNLFFDEGYVRVAMHEKDSYRHEYQLILQEKNNYGTWHYRDVFTKEGYKEYQKFLKEIDREAKKHKLVSFHTFDSKFDDWIFIVPTKKIFDLVTTKEKIVI